MPPAPLSQFALTRQIPERPPDTGILVTLVVSSSPVLGLPVVEEFFTPALNRLHDVSTRMFRDDSAFAVEERNPQTWAFNASSLEAMRQLIARLNLEYMRRKTPRLYDVQKLMGFIDDTLSSHYEDKWFF